MIQCRTPQAHRITDLIDTARIMECVESFPRNRMAGNGVKIPFANHPFVSWLRVMIEWRKRSAAIIKSTTISSIQCCTMSSCHDFLNHTIWPMCLCARIIATVNANTPQLLVQTYSATNTDAVVVQTNFASRLASATACRLRTP